MSLTLNNKVKGTFCQPALKTAAGWNDKKNIFFTTGKKTLNFWHSVIPRSAAFCDILDPAGLENRV